MTTVNNRNVSAPSGKDQDQREIGFLNRPRKGGKSIWDWLNLIGLLAIPLVVGAATIGFGLLQLHLADLQHQADQKIANQQHQADQQRVLDQQQATILQTYIDNIQDLLLNHNLLKSKPDDDVAILARARTLSALQGLDSERKGLLVKFIYQARLIGFNDNNGKTHDPIINLRGADLSDANLHDATLTAADLDGADLSKALLDLASLSDAHLSDANLYDATLAYASLSGAMLDGAMLDFTDLTHADLKNANLVGAEINDAHFDGADLNNANLKDAILNNARFYGANLSGAHLIFAIDLTQQQLDQVYSCKKAILPPGLTCHRTPSP